MSAPDNRQHVTETGDYGKKRLLHQIPFPSMPPACPLVRRVTPTSTSGRGTWMNPFLPRNLAEVASGSAGNLQESGSLLFKDYRRKDSFRNPQGGSGMNGGQDIENRVLSFRRLRRRKDACPHIPHISFPWVAMPLIRNCSPG